MDKKAVSEVLKDGKEAALGILRSRDRQEQLLDDMRNLGGAQRDSLNDYWQAVSVTLAMLRDYFSGEYKQIPKESVILIIAAFLYILSPIRILPRKIPLGKFIERTFIVVLVLELVKGDLAQYGEWKSQNAG